MERYVGIDVSKAALDVHVLPEGEALRVSRNAAGIDELVKWLRARQPRVIALEATGGFERVVAAELDAAGLPIVVVNPARVRDFASAVGRRAKTDTIDAAVIARFAEATRPPVRPLPDEQTRGLADLVARRRQIVEMLGAERAREQRAASRRLARSCQRLIKALERELADVDDEIDQAVQASAEWRSKQALLQSVPGVGPKISAQLIAELPELGTLDRRGIAALCGLAPWTRQSGKWHGKSFTGGGRGSVRSGLFMGAMVAARHNRVFADFYKRLLASGKPKMVALIAVARKLLVVLNALLRNGELWNEGKHVQPSI
jgi:transposase